MGPGISFAEYRFPPWGTASVAGMAKSPGTGRWVIACPKNEPKAPIALSEAWICSGHRAAHPRGGHDHEISRPSGARPRVSSPLRALDQPDNDDQDDRA